MSAGTCPRMADRPDAPRLPASRLRRRRAGRRAGVGRLRRRQRHGRGARATRFSLGVASGDPAPDGFVLWTRLAPDPLAADPTTPGGMSGGAVTLGYEIASDPTLAHYRAARHRHRRAALRLFDASRVTGLAPGTALLVRFTSGDAASRIGRAITAPAPGAKLDRLRFAFASCSHYEYGYFSAYRHLTDEKPRSRALLGDYIYEFTSRRRPTLRQHSDGVTATTLPTYRNRYAQYRTDPDLQRLHAEITALTTWDDHEVQNGLCRSVVRDLRSAGEIPVAPRRRLFRPSTSTCRCAPAARCRTGRRCGSMSASPSAISSSSR